MKAHESRAAQLERYTNDRRFMQIVAAFGGKGVCVFIYAPDANGVRHRLDATTANSVCGALIPQDAKMEFYMYATCVRCVSAT